MMRYIFIFVMVLQGYLFGSSVVQPSAVYKLSKGLATDIINDISENRVYIATDAGNVESFDTTSQKRITTIHLPSITDFMGDAIDSKIFSIDKIGTKMLVLSQDDGGYSRLHVQPKSNAKLQLIISKDAHLNIIKAKFVDNTHVLLALISNDILLYDIVKKEPVWSMQASMSKFSNFALNLKRTQVAVVDESGAVHVLQTKNSQRLHELHSENVDNIFGVDFRNNVIITGGQDRRIGVYMLQSKRHYHLQSKFFVYGVGLSADGKLGAYSSNTDNDVIVFDTSTKKELFTCKGDKSIVNSIVFDTKGFYVNRNSSEIRYYKIKD